MWSNPPNPTHFPAPDQAGEADCWEKPDKVCMLAETGLIRQTDRQTCSNPAKAWSYLDCGLISAQNQDPVSSRNATEPAHADLSQAPSALGHGGNADASRGSARHGLRGTSMRNKCVTLLHISSC